MFFFFFFKQKTAYEMRISDWSSDVCSSDLIFLFDEPLSNLDAKLRVEMRTEIKKLHQRLGTTIVYVTHDQIEAMTLATRIAVMRHGEIQQLGTPREIYDKPANTFVAGFMGSPPMNMIPARLVKGELGRARGRERVWYDVLITGVAG